MSQLEREVSALIEECERLQPADARAMRALDVREAVEDTVASLDGLFDGIMA